MWVRLWSSPIQCSSQRKDAMSVTSLATELGEIMHLCCCKSVNVGMVCNKAMNWIRGLGEYQFLSLSLFP